MNEEALQYSFELFSKDGYEGSIEDYKELIGSNKEALDYSYSLFSGDGFDGDKSKFSELVGVTSAKTMAGVGEDVATPADTVLASEDGSLESLEINQPEQDETSKFLSGLNYLPPISDIKEDTKAVEEKVGADKKPSIKDPFSFQPLTMASEERGPNINSQINIDKDKENQLNYLAKENPIVLPSIEGMSLTTEDVENKIQTKKDSIEYNNSFLRTRGLDEPTRNSYKDDNRSLNYDIINLQLVKAQKDINNESFDYGDFNEIKRNYSNLYGGALPMNVELLDNAEQAYLNIEQYIAKDLNSEIKNLDMDALTKIDNNGSERADIDKITEAAEKLTLKKTGVPAYQSPVVYSMAYETIRNLAEQNGKLKAANKIVSNNPEAEELKNKIGRDRYDAFISGSEYYKVESNAYSERESKLKNEFYEKQLELQSEFELFSKEKTSELQANVSNGLISAVDANEELAKYNAALFKNVRARESSLISITNRKSDSLLNDFNKKIASEQEEFNKKYKIPDEDQELLSNIYSEAWTKASENERYRLKSNEERYNSISKDKVNPALKLILSPLAAVVLEGIPNIGKEMNNAIGRSISSFGVMSNNPLFIEIGDDMKSNFSVAKDNLQNFSDLTDFSKVTKSIGRGLGSALPSIAVGSTVAALSGGIGTIPAMGLVASAGWISETSDMAGSIYRDTYAETGSLLKAEQASSELISKQLGNWYLYTLDGIPFVGKSLKRIPTAAGRIAVAGGVESVTETGQETVQTAQEEAISKSVRSGGPITASGWEERINSGMIKKTFLEVAPSSMLMGIGGRAATEYQDVRNRNKFAEGIINKYKLSAVDENGSFIAQRIAESVFQHGENFTTSWISTLLETGKITEREFSNLSRKVTEYNLLKQDYSFFNKLSPKDKNIYILLSHNVSALEQEAKDSKDGKVLNTESTDKARAELKEFVKDPMLWSGDYVNISLDDKSFLMTSAQFSDLMLASPEMFSEGNNVSVNIFNNPELSKEFNNLLDNKQEINETATETTEQPTADVQEDKRDSEEVQQEVNKGYRAGNLIDKAEKFVDGSRSTGHFGTGFYFFGKKDAAVKHDEGAKRGVSEIDLDGYNLAEGTKELHSELKNINNNGNTYEQNITGDDISSLMSTLGMLPKNPIKTPRNQSEEQALLDDGMTQKEIDDLFTKAIEWDSDLQQKNEDIAKRVNEELKNPNINSENRESGSTLVMKELGFDGVDSRSNADLDNGVYGSVIYDIKESKPKQETQKDGEEVQQEEIDGVKDVILQETDEGNFAIKDENENQIGYLDINDIDESAFNISPILDETEREKGIGKKTYLKAAEKRPDKNLVSMPINSGSLSPSAEKMWKGFVKQGKASKEKIGDDFYFKLKTYNELKKGGEEVQQEEEAEPTVAEYQKALDILEPLGSEYSSLTVNQLQEVYEALGENSENVIDISKKQNAQALYIDLSNKKEALESSAQDITPEVQEEVDAMEADENLDMSGLDAATPEFKRKTVGTLTESQNTEQDIKEVEILEILNKRADSVIDVSEIKETEDKPSQIDVKELNKRTGGDFKEFDINTLDGVGVIWNISDQLTTGNYDPSVTDIKQNYYVTNPLTGNKITNLKGGMGFGSVKGHEGIAWASINSSKVKGQQDAALRAYNKNPDKYNKLWADGILPDGHIPMIIVKMGNDSIFSNEAMMRVIVDNLSSFPKKNKKAALESLKEKLEASRKELKEKVDTGLGVKNKEGKRKKLSPLSIVNSGKFMREIEDVQRMIKDTKPKSIEDVLSTKNLKLLNSIASVVQITKLITSGDFKVLKKEPSKSTKKPVLISLYGKNPSQQDINKFNIKKITDVITEPELKGVPQRSAFMVTAIDIKNPEIVKTNHPNYPVGPKGKVLGVLKQPISIVDLVPSAYNNVALGVAREVAGRKPSLSDQKRLTQTIPVQAGLANKEFLGTPIGVNTDRRFIDFIQRSFPDTNIIIDTDTFNSVMQRDGVKEYLKDGDVVYGVTVEGEIFINPEVHNTSSDLFNTSIHEMGHVWTKYIQQTPKGKILYNKGIALVKETDTYREQLNIFDGDVIKAAEEAMAILIGNKGESITNQAINSKWGDWLIGLWDYVKSQFKRFKNLKIEEIQELNLQEFLGTALSDILGGNPIKLTEKQIEAMKSDAEFSKSSLLDKVNDIIKQARGLGYSEAAIKAFLKKKGVDPSIITSALSDKTKPASKRPDMNKVKPEGYDRVMAEIDGVIAKTKARNTTDSTSPDILFKNSLSYLQGTKVYENATDVQRELLVRDLRKKLGFKEKSAPSTNKVLATPKSKIGAIDEMAALKNQVKLEARSSRLSIKDLNERRKELSGKISELKKNGKITTNQARVIINKIGSVNLYNAKSVDSFLNYMEKVYNNADYADKVVAANSLKNNIKKLSKSKNLDPVLARLGESFQKISIRLIDDIDKYTEIAESVKEGLTSSKIKGTEIDWTSAVSVKDTEAYIEAQIKKQEAVILENKRQEFLDITGLDASKLSYNEMMSILNDPKEEAIDKTKEKLIRDNIQKVFNSYKTIIESIIKGGRNPFSLSGEKISLPNQGIIKRFMDMEISDMEIRDAIRAVDALNNYMVNGLTSGMEGIVSVYEGGKKTEALVKKAKIKAKPLKLFGFKGVGRLSGQEITTLPILIERMFKSQENARKVMKAIGVDGIIRGKSSAIKDLNLILDSYLSKFEDKKPNGKAFNDSSNIIERGMVGFARRTVMGDNDAVKAEFNRRKDLIKESISVLREGTDKEKKKSEEYQSVYDKILKDSESIQDVDSKADKVNLTAVKWWGDKFSGYYSEMADVSLNIYNDILDLSVNYNPDSFTSTEGKRKKGDEFDWSESAMSSAQSSLVQKKSGSLEAVKLPTRLNTNTYISLDFDTNNAAILKAALIDIRTAADIQVLKGALASDYFKELVPTKEDREVLESRLKGYVRNTRGKNLSIGNMSKDVQEAINILASLGVSRALGGITQPLKQMGPVAVNTLINSGRLDLTAIFDVDFNKWLDASGYSIANRGFASDTTLDNINRALEQQAKSKARKSLLYLEKVNKMWLETFLVKPDAAIARSSWQSYYKQSLKKQGLEYGNIDWKAHKINKVAGAYAEQQVSRQQNVSDSDLQGDFMTSKNPWAAVARKVLIPFQNFQLNQKQRMYSDVIILTSKTSSAQDKSSAARSLAGLAGEMATYYGIRFYIGNLLLKATAFMMGYDESEEEEEKRIKQNKKSAATNVVIDFLSPMPLTDPLVTGGFNEAIGLFQQDIPEKERFELWNKTEKGWLESLGILGMGIQGGLNLKELGDMAYTGKYTSEYMGTKTTKTIPSESQDMLKYLFLPATLFTFGFAPSEVGTVIRYGVKIAKKQGKTDDQMKYRGPSPGKDKAKTKKDAKTEKGYGSKYLNQAF